MQIQDNLISDTNQLHFYHSRYLNIHSIGCYFLLGSFHRDGLLNQEVLYKKLRIMEIQAGRGYLACQNGSTYTLLLG